jgi:surfactin synthase thioesterase subunit
LKLFCFPHAGGFSLYYNFLRKHEYQHIDRIFLFDYPRNSFTFDGTSEDFRCYVKAALSYIMKNLAEGEEYLLFGHSMGAFVACEAGLTMQNTHKKAPAGVIVSGTNPPYAVTLGKYNEMPKDKFSFAKKLGGLPQQVLDDPEKCEKIFRIAETDLKAIAVYQPTQTTENDRLDCGLVLHGEKDIIIDPAYHSYWNRTFSNIYSDMVFSGDHFYLDNHHEEIATLIDDFAGARAKERSK